MLLKHEAGQEGCVLMTLKNGLMWLCEGLQWFAWENGLSSVLTSVGLRVPVLQNRNYTGGTLHVYLLDLLNNHLYSPVHGRREK